MKESIKNAAADPRNRLVLSDYGTGRVTLDGIWSLTGEHDLKYHILGKDKHPLAGKTIILRGDIEDASGDALGFKVRDYRNLAGVRSGTISLRGAWRADEYNRVTFDAVKGNGRYDTFTLRGAWEVNESNELVYTYLRKNLKTKKKEEREVIFKGHWDLAKDRITYSVEHSQKSRLTFKAGIRSAFSSASGGELVYSLGASYAAGGTAGKGDRTVTFHGDWSVTKDLEVIFTMTPPGGVSRGEIEFGIKRLVRKKEKIALFLTGGKGRKPGIKLEFAEVFGKNAEFFLELQRAERESEVTGGVKIKF